MRYRVEVFHGVDADTPEEAKAIALERDAAPVVIVTPMEMPERRHDFRRDYVQPIEVLDLAWDQYMDRTLPPELRAEPRTPRLPSLVDLAGGVNPPQLSMLFDLAITAYAQGVAAGAIPAPVSLSRR